MNPKSLKEVILLFCLPIIIVSCSKNNDLSAPANLQAGAPISYSNASISIINFKAVEISKNNLKISFSTLYEKNIQKLELFSGSTETQLCSIYQQNESENSLQKIDYSITDTDIKGTVMYYMIKFTLTDGNWGYTPVYKLQLK
ncbi:MAG: hypothetical protein ACR2FN_03670 [Chitinophagaceae bacterium]